LSELGADALRNRAEWTRANAEYYGERAAAKWSRDDVSWKARLRE
jgi:hypothetical protein